MEYKGIKVYTPSRYLIDKWLIQICEKEGRSKKYWHRYARVERFLQHKAFIYAAYRFAKEYPNEVGVIPAIWGYYINTDKGVVWQGQSIIIDKGVLKFWNVSGKGHVLKAPQEEVAEKTLQWLKEEEISHYYYVAVNLQQAYGYKVVKSGEVDVSYLKKLACA